MIAAYRPAGSPAQSTIDAAALAGQSILFIGLTKDRTRISFHFAKGEPALTGTGAGRSVTWTRAEADAVSASMISPCEKPLDQVYCHPDGILLSWFGRVPRRYSWRDGVWRDDAIEGVHGLP